ncbi:MAG TPA: TIGR00730 family Rossman fold protein [Phycisphaerales bacterium]|nr:TIGR00730 family Rossman fold protein [Phycisphaerales bacterium]
MGRYESVAVYCASSDGLSPHWRAALAELGGAIARRGLTLVYGGGRVGLMGAVADAALAEGGKVIGVIPRAMVEAERAHTGVSDLRVVDTMHQRKQLMVDLSGAFIAAPGGFGTLDELFETITWAQLGIHGKPIGLLNTPLHGPGSPGFYDGLAAFLDTTVASGFIQPRFRALIQSAAAPDALLDLLARAQPVQGAGWARRPG